ncbi:serpin family protein [Isoptericola sp. b441]|uniref:Serpin family protein n=1 Tax=Actinotalea lenta TaxID=3064654 RepID=A0ABT9DAI1_9CELL|nr:serpin family protein [Isoptericola sp. b441]MDO8107909.1 serpin family protein [Isoptericola sp. b441]
MRCAARAAAMLAGTLGLAACGSTPTLTMLEGQGERAQVTLVDAAAAEAVVAASWRAGFAALGAGSEPAGTVVSPASLVVALSMLAEAARGESAAALDTALGASGDARTDAINALSTTLARYEGDPAAVGAAELPEIPVVHLANQVVVDDEQDAQQSYLDRLTAGYGAGVLVTDLASDEGKRDLDAWVREHTGGLVKKSAITPAPELVLVLQNAVALAARWATSFDPNLTQPDEFTRADGTSATVDMMQLGSPFAYVEREGWRAVRLPYLQVDEGNPQLYADVMLPPEGSQAAGDPTLADPAAVEALSVALGAQATTDVLLAMPKVDLTSSLDLLPVLDALGLGALTSAQTAHLDGLLVDPPAPPYVAQAVQQGVLQVDEDGTRAAAVTEMGIAAGAAPPANPVTMTVDRPFLIVITDGASGWPLFLAAVQDPSATT